jgi:hypothetical protein
LEKEPINCTNRQLAESMAGLRTIVASSQRQLLRFVREHDSRKLWERDGCRNMGQWLAARFGISVAAGMRWTHAAHALEHLPLTSAAFERGDISLDKVLQLARFATAETERELLAYGRRASVNALRKRADLATRQPLEDHLEVHRARFLSWSRYNDSGAIYLEGLLPADEGAILTKALTRIAEQLGEMPSYLEKVAEQETPAWFQADGGPACFGEDTIVVKEGMPQRLADALVVLASGHIAQDPDPDRATVVVSTTLEALQSGDRGCELEGSGVIHPEIARRLSCDCRLQFVLKHPNGTVAGYGRADRNISPSLRRQLLARDGGCTFPGCEAKRFVDGHHIWHWEDGGPTQLDNLTAVCHFHHKLLHEFGWNVKLDSDQVSIWFRPDGRRLEPALTA